MTDARSQPEIDAERAVRRGDLKEGLLLYRGVLAERPGDPQLLARIATIEGLLQPSELNDPALRAPPAPAPRRAERPPTPEQQAEMLFDRGDYPGALATYERILVARPDHQLARERAHEIRVLAGMQPAAPPAPALPADRPGILEALLVRIAS